MSPREVTCPNCQTENQVPVGGDEPPTCTNCHAKLPWVVYVTAADFDDAVNTSALVIVDFFAEWSGPSRTFTPALLHLATVHAGDLKVVKVNIDDDPELTKRFDANGGPTVLVMTGGEVREQIARVLPVALLDAAIQPYLPSA